MRKTMLAALMLICGSMMTDPASARYKVPADEMLEAPAVKSQATIKRGPRAKEKAVKARKHDMPTKRAAASASAKTAKVQTIKAPTSEERIRALKLFHEEGDLEAYPDYLKQVLAYYLHELYGNSVFDTQKVRENINRNHEQRGINLSSKELDQKVRLIRRVIIEKGRGQQAGVLVKALEVADQLADYYKGLSRYGEVKRYRLVAADLDPTDSRQLQVLEAEMDEKADNKPVLVGNDSPTD